ncbi:MAG: YbaN family protein [Brevirhabdus sp.]
MRVLWLSLGLISVGLGAVGVVLPLLPTVPFMLLAAFCFARSSDRLHDWLVNHPNFGPSIEDWRRNGAIRRRVKWYATASIAVAFLVPLSLGVRASILAIQAVTLLAVLTFIWTRPED